MRDVSGVFREVAAASARRRRGAAAAKTTISYESSSRSDNRIVDLGCVLETWEGEVSTGDGLESSVGKQKSRAALSQISRSFVRAALAVHADLSTLDDVLARRRRMYLSHSADVQQRNSFATARATLSNAQRDEMDAEAAAHLRSCRIAIDGLEKMQRESAAGIAALSATSTTVTGQVTESVRNGTPSSTNEGKPAEDIPALTRVQAGIVAHLRIVLQRVMEVFADQRQERAAQQERMPTDGYYKLEPLRTPSSTDAALPATSSSSGKEEAEPLVDGSVSAAGATASTVTSASAVTPDATVSSSASIMRRRRPLQAPVDNAVIQATFKNMTPSEFSLMQQENSALLTEFEHFSEATAKIEQQVAEVGDLMQLFSAKVAEQHSDVVIGHDMAVESTENVDRGAEELIKATRRGVDMRIFVLLFMIVCSLALLFLHWIH